MKKIYFVLLVIFYSFSTFSQEPFVVLEHSNKNYSTSSKIDMYNPFLKDSSYSQIHTVKPGDSLSGIINKYYKNTGLNMRIVELSIVEINKKAFVRNNPNYLYAGKKIKIPSINEIMNLVMNKSDKNQTQNSSSHIYFFGGN
ncbi:LysM peptidoglycan-binding domain-containing protein [Rickettsiales bacterium]|nr:LysM peptidoglycan-binding domain-containing protein [Rickettsiales bacterium]